MARSEMDVHEKGVRTDEKKPGIRYIENEKKRAGKRSEAQAGADRLAKTKKEFDWRKNE